MFEEGSIWRKWDLHIHSPLSILSNNYKNLEDGTPDWESFISKLESLDIAVLGITDYFTIEGYKKLKEFKAQGRLSNIHTILPNIEFRLNSVLSSRKDGDRPRRLNFHVIFSDEVSIQDIEEHFLHDLNFFYEGNPQDKDSKRKLKISNIEELGKTLIDQHQNFKDSGQSPLEVGAMQTVVGHEEITKALEDKRFKGKYLVIFPEELSNLIDWNGQDHHTRKGILQKSDMVFSSNSKTRNWCLGKDPYTEGLDKFLEEFKTRKACIHGSDAHRLIEVGHPCTLRGAEGHNCESKTDCKLKHCWIKADPTFEGLKQLLYESEDRVIIQEENPTPIKSNYTIKKFKISESTISSDLSIKATEIELNSNLVAVTGSKGSGKTAFVDLIANCYKDRCNTKDPNSFVRRIKDDNPNIETTIIFKDTAEFKKTLTDKTFYDNSDVVYIAQGELENYIGEDSDLDIYIKNLIFESPKVKDTVKDFEFNEIIKSINDIENKLSKKNNSIISLEEQTSDKEIQKITLEKKQKESDLKDIENRIKALEKAQSKEKIELAQKKQEAISVLKSKKDDLINLRDAVNEAVEFITDDINAFNENIKVINSLLTKLNVKESYNEISYQQKEALVKRLEETNKTITLTVSEIENAQKEIEQYEAGIKEHAKFLDKKQEATSDIANLVKKLGDLNNKKVTLTQQLAERKTLLTQLIEKSVEQKIKYEEIITSFSAQKADVLSELTFEAKLNFNEPIFLHTAESIMDNRKVTIYKDDDTNSIFDDLVLIINNIVAGVAGEIDKYIDEIEKLVKEQKANLKRSQDVSLNDLYHFLYGNYFSVIPIVKYKNTQINKLSLGQKATVLIKIYLAQGDKPIIIDSHDDHLDNEFIMEELVKAIRQAKQFRQIILASNNGNVVINSDAEQIIIASRDKVDGKISYMSGSIENPIIRERSIKVLEGGSEAFRKRQQKYRLTY
jgi:energy-coupling factor transporter ATP-binding protein EcfA2